MNVLRVVGVQMAFRAWALTAGQPRVPWSHGQALSSASRRGLAPQRLPTTPNCVFSLRLFGSEQRAPLLLLFSHRVEVVPLGTEHWLEVSSVSCRHS